MEKHRNSLSRSSKRREENGGEEEEEEEEESPCVFPLVPSFVGRQTGRKEGRKAIQLFNGGE